MEFKRETYLQKIIESKHNGLIKVITGIRRSGKSYLLFNLFKKHLLSQNIDTNHIIEIKFDDRENANLRNPDKCLGFIKSKITDGEMHYLLLDEVQLMADFVEVLNSCLYKNNVDVYVTGSNSKFLSSDIITEFRGRGDEIRLFPLSFKEFLENKSGNRDELLLEYLTYGGLPQVVIANDENKKKQFLKSLFSNTYVKDIKERHNIEADEQLEELINTISSNIGGLTNPTKLENTFKTLKNSTFSAETIKKYLDYLEDSFLIEKSIRYDIKGKRYISTPYKYYFLDLGLRNVRLDFRQTEYTHLLENAIYNELRMRGFSVDVGQVFLESKDENEKRFRKTLEVDFVCNLGYKRIYIQSAYAMPNAEKLEQELKSLKSIRDEFKKVVILGSPTATYQNNDGILITNVYDFFTNTETLFF